LFPRRQAKRWTKCQAQAAAEHQVKARFSCNYADHKADGRTDHEAQRRSSFDSAHFHNDYLT
jgi:hypothetical protein